MFNVALTSIASASICAPNGICFAPNQLRVEYQMGSKASRSANEVGQERHMLLNLKAERGGRPEVAFKGRPRRP